MLQGGVFIPKTESGQKGRPPLTLEEKKIRAEEGELKKIEVKS